MEKDASISATRLMAMSFIVACHILQRFDHPLALWFNIGVQIFFVISGFLYGNRRIDKPLAFIYKNWCKILIPCWLFLFATLFCFGCVGYELPKGMKFVRIVLLSETLSGLGHLWFVSYILFCYLMVPFLDCLKKSLVRLTEHSFVANIGIIFLIIAVIGVGYRPHVKPSSIICFMIGYFLAIFQSIFGIMKGRCLECGLMIMGGGALLLRVAYEICPWNGSFGRLYLACFPYLKVGIGVSLFLVMKKFFSCSDNQVLRFSDRYSYSIYLTHHIFIMGPLSLMGSVHSSIIMPFAVILSAILLKELTDPINKYCTRKFEH